MKILLLILLPFLSLAQSVWYVDKDASGSANGTSWANAWTHFREGVAGGVDWSSLSGGDTLYISGGTDTTFYYEDGHAYSNRFLATDSTLYSPQLIIRPSWEAGHNGVVCFIQGDVSDYMFLMENIHGVRLENFTAYHYDEDIRAGGGFYGNNITVSGWHFRGGDGGGGMLKIDGNNWLFDDCLFEREENEYPVDTDMFGQNNSYSYTHQTTGSGVIKNCTFIYRNGYTFEECIDSNDVTVGSNYVTDTNLNMTEDYHVYNGEGTMVRFTDDTSVVYNDWKYLKIDSNNTTTFYGEWIDYYSVPCAPPPSGKPYIMEGSHRDAMQFGELGRPEFCGDSVAIIVVANNLIIDTNPRGSGWNKMVYSYTPEIAYIFYLYNNIIVSRKNVSSNRNIGIEGAPVYTDPIPETYFGSKYVFNNTVITKGAVSATQNANLFLTIYPYDTLMIKNNLFLADSAMTDGLFNIDHYGGDGYTEWNYNYYALDDSIPTSLFTWYDNDYRTYSYWISTLNFDVNSMFHLNTDVTFAEKYGLDFADYLTTAGRDSAVDLSTFDNRLPPDAPPISEDILGNPRSGAWDIGALEYQSGGSVVNGGWLRGSSGKKIYDKNGKVIITR